MVNRIRGSYFEVYKNIENDWNLDGCKIYDILESATQKLIDEAFSEKTIDVSILENMHGRTWEEYVYDIIDGWITEDLIQLWLKKSNIYVYRDGCDANRQIHRTACKVDSTADFRDEDGFPIEIQQSISERPSYIIRIWKAKRIIIEGGIILYIIPSKNKYFIVNRNQLILSPCKYSSLFKCKCYSVVPKKYYGMDELIQINLWKPLTNRI
jgi:hypothetical protein